MSTPRGKFYLAGLGLLIQGVRFTPAEQETLAWLCEAANESDAAFWDATRGLSPGSPRWRALEDLKKTLRRLGKHQILQAHYDRATDLYRPVPAD